MHGLAASGCNQRLTSTPGLIRPSPQRGSGTPANRPAPRDIDPPLIQPVGAMSGGSGGSR